MSEITGARVRLKVGGVLLLDDVGEVRSFTIERGPEGLRVTLHMPDPMRMPEGSPE